MHLTAVLPLPVDDSLQGCDHRQLSAGGCRLQGSVGRHRREALFGGSGQVVYAVGSAGVDKQLGSGLHLFTVGQI